jgi:hypothetical protein
MWKSRDWWWSRKGIRVRRNRRISSSGTKLDQRCKNNQWKYLWKRRKRKIPIKTTKMGKRNQ